MQQNYKHSFTDSKMQKDLDARLVSPREYRDAVNVAVSRSEGSDVGALENILGNEFISSLGYPGAGLDVRFFIIGWYIDEDQDKIYTFVTDYKDNSATKLENKAGPLAYCSIVETDTKTGNSDVLVTGSFLNFSENSPINHVDLIEDLLFWTDNRNQPRQINIGKGETYTKESDVSVAKYYPYQPMSVKREYKLTNCVFTSKIESTALTPGYDAWYDYFILEDNPSQDIVDTFTDNIGAKGFVEDSNGDRFEFKVAFFQQDGFYPDAATLDTTFLPAPFNSSDNVIGNPNRKYLLFIDRALSTTTFPQWDGAANPVPASNKYSITLFQENCKDISSPWKQEDQFKMTCYDTGGGTIKYIQMLPNSSTFNSLIPSMFYFGTRSCPNNEVNGTINQWSAWAEPPSATPLIFNPNRQVNSFPTNTPSATFPTIDTKNAYIKVTHPKIPKQNNVALIEIVQAPVLVAPGPPSFLVIFGEYTSLRNGTIESVDLYTKYGIANNDVLSFHLPNKFYNQDFPGDPAFLEDKFVRFAYRYKFNNGEYSLLSPFTQAVFIPKQGGYFQKYIGTNKQSASNNDILNQEQEAGENTIVEFLTNEITEVALDIPLPTEVNKLKEILNVDEIEVVYKESTALGLKVVEKLPLSDYSLDTNKFLTYVYQSRRPIKTLPDSVITRVYDKVPIRAATQASAGNRIIYGNFIDAHTSPLTLDYLVGVSPKFTPAFKEYTGSDIAYPNHTLKQNRTYQVGVILQDKYGRSSDVILSGIRDSSYEESNGPFSNNPIVFGGSTIYSEYFDNVINPAKSSGTTQNPRAGLVDWPGNSLKILFANTIPNTITTNAGYPGLYSNLKTNLLYANTGTTTNIDGLISVEFSPSTGDISLAVVGDYISFNNTEFEVGAIDITNNVLWIKDNVDAPFSAPSVGDKIKLIERNELGFYSYKIVVKQTEQEYYNVYLPSILNGAPIIKPFKLDISGVSNVGTVNNTIINPAAQPRTFLLLEGMNFTVGSVEYTITNILNDENFTYSPAATFTSTPNVEFSTKSSKNLINVTTLLTDNANKVPPGLLETTPVQQQYSPSDTTLYPRVAIQEGYTATNPYFTGVLQQNIPIFPGRRDLKVRAVGNFFALNTDANTAGLYEAKSDPPSANIENVFRLGRDAETALPDSIEPLVFTTYETNPVKSELDIFWETGTAGLIEDLNNNILNQDDVVFDLSTGSSPWNESIDTTGTPGSQRLLLMTVRNRNGGIITPASFEECALVNITDQSGNTIYNSDGSGTPISLYTNAGVAKTKVDATLSSSQFGISLDSRGLLYYSNTLQLNYLNFTFRCIINNPLENIYDFPLTFTLRNQAPVRLYGQPPSNTVGVTINSGITQTREGSPTPLGSWSNSSVAGTFRATNGANTNNASGSICSLEIVYKIQAYDTGTLTWYDYDSKHQGLEIQTYNNPNYPSPYGKILSIGDVADLDGSSISPNPIELRIIATDMNGNGLTTTISEFKLEFI